MIKGKANPLFGPRIPVLRDTRNLEDDVLLARKRFGALFNKESKSVYCQQIFTEHCNLGSLECDITEHASVWDGEVYSCCGQKDIFHPGCRKLDHSSYTEYPLRWWGDKAHILIPEDQVFKPPVSTIEYVEPNYSNQREPIKLAKIARFGKQQ